MYVLYVGANMQYQLQYQFSGPDRTAEQSIPCLCLKHNDIYIYIAACRYRRVA